MPGHSGGSHGTDHPVRPDAGQLSDQNHCPRCAERAFLIAVRWWVSAFIHDEDPVPHLSQHLHTIGVRDAAFSVDALMAIIARTVRQPIAIRCPYCPHLSADEAHLLHAASLVQAGERALAERALRTALLAASGAEFALGPLAGLGELFARASLLFSRRQSYVGEPSPAGAIETWSPSIPTPTLH
jgi:hypothetical protein